MKKIILLSIILAVLALMGALSAQAKSPEPPPGDELSWEEGLPKHHMRGKGGKRFKKLLKKFAEEHPDEAKVLKKFMKERKKEFKHKRGGPPGDFQSGMDKKHKGPWHKAGKMRKMKEKDPERYKRMMEIKELDEKENELGKKFREARGRKEKGKIAKELRALLEKDFQMRQTEIQNRVKRVEQKLKDIKTKFETRQKKKAEIVNKRFDKLTGDKDYLDW